MTTEPKPFGIPEMVVRYLLVMIATMVLLVLVIYLLERFAGYRPTSSMGIVTGIVPALDAGHTFARKLQRVPTKREAWGRSVVMVAANLVFGVVVLTVAFALAETRNPLTEMVDVLGGGAVAVIVGVILVVYLLLTRFIFGSGAKSEVKRAARVAQKQQ